MKVLVTGGTGYVGRAIVRALTGAGHTTVVFARTATRSGLPGQLVDGDICDRAALDRAADGVEAICHAAALVSIWRRRRQDFDDINVGGLENAIEVCRARRIARLVYTSSFLALPPAGHDRPIEANDYQRTKVAALRVARAAVGIGTPIVTLAPGVIYGPGSSTDGNLVGRMVQDHLRRRLPGVIGGDRQWPIWFKTADGDIAFALEPGDAVVYDGRKLSHWREPFQGDIQIQCMLFYVTRNGPHAAERYDGRPGVGFPWVPPRQPLHRRAVGKLKRLLNPGKHLT